MQHCLTSWAIFDMANRVIQITTGGAQPLNIDTVDVTKFVIRNASDDSATISYRLTEGSTINQPSGTIFEIRLSDDDANAIVYLGLGNSAGLTFINIESGNGIFNATLQELQVCSTSQIDSTEADTDAPELVSAERFLDKLRVTFNKPVRNVGKETPFRYSIDSGSTFNNVVVTDSEEVPDTYGTSWDLTTTSIPQQTFVNIQSGTADSYFDVTSDTDVAVAFVGITFPAAFTISSSDNAFSDITGYFTPGADSDQARTDIKNALNASSEFTALWTFDTDTDVSENTVARYKATSDGPKGSITLAITQNDGDNTTPYNNVVTEGQLTSSFSISSTGNDIPAITGSFTSGADAEQGRTDLKTALNADAEFTNLFEFDTDIDTDSVINYIDFRFSGSINTVTFNGISTGRTIFIAPEVSGSNALGQYGIIPENTSVSTIEDLVDAIVAAYDTVSLFTDYGALTKVGTDTVRLTPDFVGLSSNDVFTATTFGISVGNNFNVFSSDTTVHISVQGYSDTESITASGDTDTLRVDDSTADFANGRTLRATAKKIARYEALSDTDYEDFMFTITANDGSNTDPYLNVFQNGAIPPASSGTPTMYLVRDYAGAEVTMFTSSVNDITESDSDTVLSMIYDAINTNVETPIDFVADTDSDGRLRLTAQTGGAIDGSWSISVNNHGQVSNAGNITYTGPIVINEGTSGTTFTFTDPSVFVGISNSALASGVGEQIANAEDRFYYIDSTSTLYLPENTTFEIEQPNTLTVTKEDD